MKTQVQITDYANLIYKSAWAAAKRCGLLDEIDDVLQEAWVSACNALRSYNPDKSALATHLADAVYLRTLRYYAKRQRFDSLPDNYDVAYCDNREEWTLFWESLTDGEKEMAARTMLPNTGKKTAIVKHFTKLWGGTKAAATAKSLQRKLAAC